MKPEKREPKKEERKEMKMPPWAQKKMEKAEKGRGAKSKKC